MIWDFTGHRPLPVRDYKVSIEALNCEITCHKFGDCLYGPYSMAELDRWKVGREN